MLLTEDSICHTMFLGNLPHLVNPMNSIVEAVPVPTLTSESAVIVTRREKESASLTPGDVIERVNVLTPPMN